MDIRYALAALALVACSEQAAPRPSPTTASPTPSAWRSVAALEIRTIDRGPLDAAACANRTGVLWTQSGDACYLAGPSLLRLDRFVRVAAVQQEDGLGSWVLDLVLPDDLGQKLGDVSGAHLNQPLLFVLDGKLLAAPTVHARVSTAVQLSGDFTRAGVEQIANRLRAMR